MIINSGEKDARNFVKPGFWILYPISTQFLVSGAHFEGATYTRKTRTSYNPGFRSSTKFIKGHKHILFIKSLFVCLAGWLATM